MDITCLKQNDGTIKIYTDENEYNIINDSCMLIYDKKNRNKGVKGVYNSTDIIKFAMYLAEQKDTQALQQLFRYLEREGN